MRLPNVECSELFPIVDRVASQANGYWDPGRDCGTWVGPRNPVQEQAQVIILNVVTNLTRTMGGASGYAVEQAAANLLGVSRSCVRDLSQRMNANGFVPIARAAVGALPQADDQRGTAEREDEGQRDELRVMVMCMREIVNSAYYGRGDVDYVRALRRLSLANIDVGDKYHSRAFAVSVESFVTAGVQRLTNASLEDKGSGLGVRSDVAIMYDGVSIGSTHFSTHETLLLIGLTFLDKTTGDITDRLVGAPSCGYVHTGDHVAMLVFTVLQSGPWRLTKAILRKITACVGGDGAVCEGGPQHRHRSTKSANIIWATLFPTAVLEAVDWDLFHRTDIGGRRAMNQFAICVEIFDVARVMGSLFGVGSGRVILRGVAAELGACVRRVATLCGTRKVVYLSRVTHNLLYNFPCYHGGLWVRQSRASSRKTAAEPNKTKSGAQSLGTLIEIGRRLLSLDFVAFLLLFHDLQRFRVRPFALASEKTNCGAVTTHTKLHSIIAALRQDKLDAAELGKFVLISALVSTKVSVEDLQHFWMAYRSKRWARAFPTFCRHAMTLMWTQTFRGCRLIYRKTPAALDPAITRCCHPACRCSFERAYGDRRLPRGEWTDFAGRRVLAPFWVTRSVRGDDPTNPVSRFLFSQKDVTHSFLQGCVARFKKQPNEIRCLVPLWLPEAILFTYFVRFNLFPLPFASIQTSGARPRALIL